MKKITYIFLLILFSTQTVFSQGVEICNNGIDDDNDGLIDLNDPDCHCDGFTTTVPSMIPNPSFEDYTCCPDDFSELYCAVTWMQASDATSDYWNTCNAAGNSYAGLPPQPAPDGNGYVGFINMSGWQEYIGACLSEPMVAGNTYILNFWVGPSNMSPDFDLTFFGATDCNNLPFDGDNCPVGQGSWQELTSIHVHFDSHEWINLTVTFTPTQDIYALVFGPPCNSNSDYTYYYLDNLILNVTTAFSSISIDATGHLCTNDMVLHAHSGVDGNWQWYYNGVAIVGQTDSILNVSALGYGEGTYQARISNSEGCDVGEYEVSVSYPTVSVTSTSDVSCYNGNDGSIDISVTGGTAPFSYSWTGPNGFSSTSEDLTNIYAGDYAVTVTDSNGCTTSTSATINQPTQLIIDSDSIIHEQCPGYANGSIDITPAGGTAPYSFSWSNGQTTEDINNLTQGTYSVTVTDNNGCSIIQSYQVNTLYPTPTSDFTIDSVWCYQDTTIVRYVGNASPGGNYYWTFSNGNVISGSAQGPYQINWLSPGFYNVSLWVEENGCVSDTTTVTIQNPPQLNVTLSPQDLLCFQDNTGEVTSLVSGGIPQYSYSWSTGASDSAISNLPAGNYSLTVTDSRGCEASASTVVNEPEQLIVTTPDYIQHCNGLPLSIESSVTGGTLPYTYEWSDGSTYPTLNIEPTIDMTVTVTVTDANGCTATSSTTIDVNDPVQFDIFVSRDSVCKGDRVILSGTITGGVGSPYSITNQNGDVVTFPVMLTVNHDTTIILTATDACGSHDADTAVVNIYPMPFVIFAADTIAGCQPFTVNFNITQGADQIHDHIWNFGDNDNINLSLGPNPSHTYNDYGVYTVTLMYTTNKGCKDTVQIEDMITVYKKPRAEFVNDPQVGTVVNPVIDFINQSEDNVLNFWSFGDGDSSIQVNPRHKYPNVANTYQAVLIVESDKGCKDTTIANIEIQDVPVFYAPTAFTPDNDGINELFFVIARNIDLSKEFYLSVYDRWGELIWATDKYDPENPSRYGWDGTVKGGGKQAPPDVYVWRCVYYTKDGNSHDRTGKITLIR